MNVIVYSTDGNMGISSEDVELVRRDLFKRYNCGMTALKKSEIARAKYLYDLLTQDLTDLLKADQEFYDKCVKILLPKAKES